MKFQDNINRTIKFPPHYQNTALINLLHQNSLQVSQITGVLLLVLKGGAVKARKTQDHLSPPPLNTFP